MRGNSGSHRRIKDSGKVKYLGLLDTCYIVIFSLLLSLTLKIFVIQIFKIPSGSMENTLLINDRIMVDKFSFWFSKDLRRGDIVVFQDPGNWLEGVNISYSSYGILSPVYRFMSYVGIIPDISEGILVKRVIGIEGDTVRCCDANNRLTINNKAIYEPYIKVPKDFILSAPSTFTVVIPKDYIWVLGDNRYNSCDSLCHINEPSHGFVPVGNVIGRVIARIWPIEHLKFFK